MTSPGAPCSPNPTDSGDWDVIIEPCGWAASVPETLAHLSAGGTGINVFWNVNAVVTFSLARTGALVRTFDALLYDDAADALPEERGLRWKPTPRARAPSPSWRGHRSARGARRAAEGVRGECSSSRFSRDAYSIDSLCRSSVAL